MTRKKLPDTRASVTKTFRIGEGDAWHVTVGLYENGKPGELFIFPPREGEESSGLADALAQSVSLGLQHGIPISAYAKKFQGMKFAPAGFTKDKQFPMVSSRLDYIGKWLAEKWPEGGPVSKGNYVTWDPWHAVAATGDGPPCQDCGALMVRSGSCYKCGNCGSTSGCS
jgi:ribonucleoside-diphosphate reductase alpha chain